MYQNEFIKWPFIKISFFDVKEFDKCVTYSTTFWPNCNKTITIMSNYISVAELETSIYWCHSVRSYNRFLRFNYIRSQNFPAVLSQSLYLERICHRLWHYCIVYIAILSKCCRRCIKIVKSCQCSPSTIHNQF